MVQRRAHVFSGLNGRPILCPIWFSVSSKLRGVLLFPASAMVGALYPTLCRLFVEDTNNSAEVSRGAFRGVALLVVPVAFGCALYPDVRVSIFNRNAFGAAEDNLRVSSLFLFLVYFSMPLGTCILAAGKNRAWSIVQPMCIVVSLVLDPLLVPWFQKHNGNGDLGVCVAGVVSEVVVVGSGMVLLPKGVIDRKLMRTIFLAVVSGAATAVFAWATRRLTPYALRLTPYALRLTLRPQSRCSSTLCAVGDRGHGQRANRKRPRVRSPQVQSRGGELPPRRRACAARAGIETDAINVENRDSAESGLAQLPLAE
jgi:hypothetical protein